jgi:hypothetical protein
MNRLLTITIEQKLVLLWIKGLAAGLSARF